MALSLIVLVASVSCSGDPSEPTVRPTHADPTRADPSPSEPPVAFSVIGDFGSGNEWEYDVAVALHEWADLNDPTAFVTTGDNVYEMGEPARFDVAWRDPYGWVEDDGIDIFASLGNHDIKTRDGQPVMKLFEMPSRWYATTIGPVRLIVLDGNQITDETQLGFLESELQTAEQAWKVVVFHHSTYSCGQRGPSPLAQEHWVPLFERYGVQLVLNGHNHLYERFHSLDGDGVTYVVTGGGGTQLYPFVECPEGTPARAHKDNQTHHFLAVTADATELTVEAIGDDGDVFDKVTLKP